MVERSVDSDDDDVEVEDAEVYEGPHGVRKLMSSRDNSEIDIADEEETNQPLVRRRRSMRAYRTTGEMTPMSVAFAANYDPIKHKGLVKPRYSTVVYRLSVSCHSFNYQFIFIFLINLVLFFEFFQDIQKTFFLLFLLVIVGEFFAAPAITLADSAVITLLGEDADRSVNVFFK